jgi:hypothetical protein
MQIHLHWMASLLMKKFNNSANLKAFCDGKPTQKMKE